MRFVLSLIIIGTIISFIPKDIDYSRIEFGSTAICISTKDGILIAADSKIVSLPNKGNDYLYAGRHCKVHQKDDIIYGVVGIFKMVNPDIDISKIISETPLSGTLKQRIVRIRNSISTPILRMATSIQVNHKPFFDSKVKNKEFISILFGAYEEDKPVVGYLRIDCKTTKRGNIYLKDSLRVEYKFPTQLEIGQREAIDSIFKFNPHFYSTQKGVINGLTTLIKYQSLKTPDLVNDTVNIIGIKEKVVSWYVKNQECSQ